MEINQLIAIVLALTAILSVINERFIKVPLSIGVMGLSMIFSFVAIIASSYFQLDFSAIGQDINFSETLMHGLLSSMLFAGALTLNLRLLLKQKFTILLLAIVGTIISTVVVGYSLYFAFQLLGFAPITLLHCLLFGALISPTDPIAVLAIMRRVGAPEDLEMLISGESLFNDAVGVVLFTVISAMIFSGEAPSISGAIIMFIHEMIGGIILGTILGLFCIWLMKQVIHEDFMLVLITLAISFSGYEMAVLFEVSGLITVIVAGLLAGYYVSKNLAKKDEKIPLEIFWSIVDEVLNAILFVLISIEIVTFDHGHFPFVESVVVLAIVLSARLISVYIPISALRSIGATFPSYVVGFLTWGGLKGGLPMALVLSLPQSPYREKLVIFTFVVVAFSMLGKGLAIGKLMKRWMKKEAELLKP